MERPKIDGSQHIHIPRTDASQPSGAMPDIKTNHPTNPNIRIRLTKIRLPRRLSINPKPDGQP